VAPRGHRCIHRAASTGLDLRWSDQGRCLDGFFFSSRRRHTRSVSAFLLNRSSDLCKIRGLMVTVCPSQFATRRTLFHVLVGCGLLMLKVSRLKLPVIWLLVSMWLNTLTKSQIWTL